MVLKKNTWVSLLLGCFSNKNQSLEPRNTEIMSPNSSRRLSLSDISNPGSSPELLISHLSSSLIGSNLHIFTLQELKLITQNFSLSNYLGQGGFGQVHRGFIGDNLRPGLEAQSVAVKVLDLDGTQGHMEWLTEVLMLGQLRHPHLVKLIGYCCEDEQRLLVYEYLPRGNLDSLIFKGYQSPLPWLTRIKIAVGAAKGLAFLHEEEKPVIYRDFKASNILLDSDLNAKLSDFGLAMDGPEGEETYVSTCVMGTEGYAAPEYIKTGHLTTMSDVYSFGVVLLELLTGRRSMDKRRPNREQNLVAWARPLLKTPQRLEKIMDPRLEGQYSTEGSKRAATLAYQCLNQHSKSRPTMSNVVKTLEPLVDLDDIPVGPFVYVFPSERDAQRNLKKNSEEKEVESKENGQEGHRNGPKRRHRKRSMRSRAVHSDTALYKTLGTSLYSPKQSESTRH